MALSTHHSSQSHELAANTDCYYMMKQKLLFMSVWVSIHMWLSMQSTALALTAELAATQRKYTYTKSIH